MSRKHPQKDHARNWHPRALKLADDLLSEKKAAIEKLEATKKKLEKCQKQRDVGAPLKSLADSQWDGGTRHRRRRRRKRRRTRRRRKSRKKSRRRKRRKSRRRRRR